MLEHLFQRGEEKFEVVVGETGLPSEERGDESVGRARALAHRAVDIAGQMS